jgi:para-nitrobenzyl esterase
VADGDVAALRALPASVVLDAPVTVPFFPVVDGEILQEDTPTSFAAGHEAHVPYLLGANDYEENLLRWLPGASQALLSSLGDRAAPLLALYTRRGEDPTRAAQRLWGENAMTLPARWRAARHASRAPTWLYRYAYVPDMLRATTPGAGHEAEMEMVFGNPSRRTSITWSTADRSMAKALSAYWVSFAKTGSPNHAGAPPWRPFRADADRLMMFDATGPHMVARFAKQRLDALDAASSPH